MLTVCCNTARIPGEKKRFGRGWIAECDTPFGATPVLSIAGEPEEMGVQYGVLAGSLVKRLSSKLVAIFASAGLPEAVVRNILGNAWERMAPFTPERYTIEFDGIVKGANQEGIPLTIDDLRCIVAATNFDLYKREERIFEFLDPEIIQQLQAQPDLGNGPLQCTMLAVWGKRTVDGKMFSFRNLDWLSQSGMHEDRIITVMRQDGVIPVVSCGYAGVTGCLAGMNAEGITLSEVGAFSVSEELNGIPWTFLGRQVLEKSSSLDDAVRMISGAKHTIGYNYLIADGDPERFGTPDFSPRAAVFETNHSACEVFFDNDPKEADALWVAPDGTVHRYGLPVEHAVMRADTAFGKTTRALQACDDGPGEPENTGNPWGRDFCGSTYTTCHRPMYDMVRAFETGDEYVFPVRNTRVIDKGTPRKIGFQEIMVIAATVAHNTECLADNDWNVMSVVYAPTDGKLAVAYESQDRQGLWKNAPDSGYALFTLGDLMAD
ncbi:MAG TPA: C45 family autoproteolytic acyltransferase/hydrolase [Candidatus Hydrogenedentes bacterium]|nr:C45 family autoproteolytic acyltransferase/hydrolase [Candidatus Hydrogenedentota bacterium]